MVVIRKIDEELLETMENEEEISEEIDNTEEFQNLVKKKIIEVEQFCKKREKKVEEKSAQIAAERLTETKKIKVRLPKLDIEKFSGDPKKYRAFRDAERNDDLTDVEKFTYLLSYITGEALRLQNGLALTNENYKVALDLLERRFGSKQVIISSHMESLYKLSAVKSNEATKSLREFYDTVETNLGSLEAISVEPESYGCLLIPSVKGKLPSELNLQLSRKFDASIDVWKIGDLMKELKLEIEARERIGEGNKSEKRTHQFETAEGLFAVGSLHCPYCQQEHYPDRCTVVTNVATRKRILQCQERCFLCTKEGHRVKECRSKRTCFLCKGQHHTSICESEKREHKRTDERRDESRDWRKNKDSQAKENQQKRNDADESKREKKTLLSTTNIEEKVILMQTASVLGRGCNTGKGRPTVKCKVLFDSGSQRTYVMKGLADATKAKILRREYCLLVYLEPRRTKIK